jgi:EmrB/QacA subfamily drug resistance transporter
MSSAATTVPASDGALTHKQILTILTGLLLGMFLAALDQMIVATAIRTIGDDLHGLSAQAWVTTSFLITSTISTLLYGKLSDIYGRKPMFMIAITIFIVGSALCGLAQSMYMLAAFRAFQGLGAGGLFTLALAIIGDLVAPRERARYQGYFMAVFATSSVLGPVVGGFFAGQDSIFGITGWRWIFYINVPIGIVALVVVNRVLHLSHQPRDHRIDWMGATALVVGLVPLLIIAEQGREWGWATPVAFACYLIGLAGLLAFVYVEIRMGEEALVPMRLFRNSVYAVGSSQSFVIGIGMFGGMASIPLYLQIVKGASPTKAGLLILPLVAGIMAASLVSGQLTSRTGRYRIFPIIGSALLVVGMLLLSTISAYTPLWQTDLYMLVFGAGLGLNMQTIVLAMQNAVPVRDMGVATSSVTFFRQVGGTLGTAVFLSILFSAAPSKIADQFQAAGVRPPAGVVNLNDTSKINTLPTAIKAPILEGFSAAMSIVFLVGAIVLVAAFVLSLMLKEVPLRQMSGMEQARADAAAAAAAAPSSTQRGDEQTAEPDGAATRVGAQAAWAADAGSPEPPQPSRASTRGGPDLS